MLEKWDTSLASERELKLPLYASAGIAGIWLVDLNAYVTERHTEPAENGLPAPPAGWTGRDARVRRVAHAHPSGRSCARLIFSRSRAEVLLD